MEDRDCYLPSSELSFDGIQTVLMASTLSLKVVTICHSTTFSGNCEYLAQIQVLMMNPMSKNVHECGGFKVMFSGHYLIYTIFH